MELLDSRACDEMQGYYFSRPVSPEIFTELMTEGLNWGVIRR